MAMYCMRLVSGVMLYLIVLTVNAQIQLEDDLGRDVALEVFGPVQSEADMSVLAERLLAEGAQVPPH